MAAVLRSAVMVIDYWCVVLWLFVFDCCVLRLQNNDIKQAIYQLLIFLEQHRHRRFARAELVLEVPVVLSQHCIPR